MSKFLMIELMLLYRRISMDRAVTLIHSDHETVESVWLHETEMDGAFESIDG